MTELGHNTGEGSHRITTSLSYLPGLLHPLWWASLALLIINDHWLKGSAMPGWMTGKLSDFTGMIVAPVLVSALVRPTRWTGRFACFGAVVLPFAAINLSAGAAELIVTMLAWVGVPWRIWSDWTDLTALAGPSQKRGSGARQRRAVQARRVASHSMKKVKAST